jgi:dihydrofolate reductase
MAERSSAATLALRESLPPRWSLLSRPMSSDHDRGQRESADCGRELMMRRVLWHTMMSLDGFIAGPNDDMRWAFGLDGGPSRTIEEVLRSTGALLVGRRTQDVENRLQPGFYGGAFRGPFFVLRHDPPSEPPVVKGVTGRFINGSIEEAVRLAKKAAGGDDVVVLGANVARQCLEAGLLDEIIVHVAPVLVGDGVRLFARSGGAAVKLTPISSADEGAMTVLRYSLGQDSTVG